MLVLTALPNGDAGWIRQRMPTRYGRWELRARCRTTSPGVPWHVLALIWPTIENWPRSGELDFLEIENPGQDFFRAYLHYPHPPGPVQQEIVTVPGIRPGEWHNYGFEWTPEHVAGFIDGKQVYRFSGGAGPSGRSAIQAMPEGALTLQLDHFGSNSACTYELDFVRFYPLA
jgi:beta-glucanase (GH16 family)